MRTAAWSGITAAVFLTFAGQLQAIEPAIRDNAGVFTSRAVEQANRIIAEMRREGKPDFVVETFSGIPDSLRSRYEREGKDAFFNEWGRSRARDLGISGVYALIVQEPGRLEVVTEGGMSAGNRDRLRDVMLRQLRQRDYDAALIEGAKFAQANSQAKGGGSTGGLPGPRERTTPGTTSPRTDSPNMPVIPTCGGGMGSVLCWGLAILAVVMIFRMFRRARSGYGRPGGYGQGDAGQGGGYSGGPIGGGYPGGGSYPGGAGGGGFGRGILGGLLGGMLGGWMSRHGSGSGGGFFGQGGGNQASGGGFSDLGSGSSGGGFSDPGGGSSGGDFGSSGGDFGGDDDRGSSGGNF